MNGRTRLIAAAVLLALAGTTRAAGDEAPKPERWAIRAAKILTMEGEPIVDGVLLVADGKIERLGPASEIAVPEGYRVFDGGDAWALPGFIDLHVHVGGTDINDMVYQVNPDLTDADNLAPNNPRLVAARRQGGVTTVLFIPGSGTNMGGFGVLMKTSGSTPEEAIVRSPGALKIAQAGNPERRGGDLGSSRVGMTHLIRETVREGLEYGRAVVAYERGEGPKPKPNDRYENFRGIAAHEVPIIVHTQWVQVIQTTMRVLHDELGVECILSHGTFESYRIAPLVAPRGIGVNVGPRSIYYDRRDGRIHGIAAEWWKGGVRNLSLNTDAPVVAAEDLVRQASVAVRFGLSEDAALRALTIVPARQVLVADRLGSLAPGKVADVVLHSGPPLDPRTRIEAVFVRGRLVDDLRRHHDEEDDE